MRCWIFEVLATQLAILEISTILNGSEKDRFVIEFLLELKPASAYQGLPYANNVPWHVACDMASNVTKCAAPGILCINESYSYFPS